MSNDFNILGEDLFGDPVKPIQESITNKRFVFPPFTILDAKQGEWQERKRMWIARGITGELGRTGLGDTSISAVDYFGNGETIAGDAGSVFDPVLCEIAYRWFSPEGGQVVDPFAGGSVRGIVAKTLGRKYWGCDLRKEQIIANIKQAEEIFEGYDGETSDMFGNPDLEWVCGDSLVTLEAAPMADFIFSCPPYGDLEVYSDDPADISNMDYDHFAQAYRNIIYETCRTLKDNRFACFVIGDFRDKQGFYRNFVSETIAAFVSCPGVKLYNEAILATPVGTAQLRVNRQFNAARKLVKTHQNVLVFCKGDPKLATLALGDPAEAEPEPETPPAPHFNPDAIEVTAPREAPASDYTSGAQAQNWNDRPQVKKGNLGEELIKNYLESIGDTVYKTSTDQAHPVDLFCAKADKMEYYFVEVKAKPARTDYPDTGFDISCWNDYKRLQRKTGLIVFIMFADEIARQVYGGPLDVISQYHVIWHRGRKVEYPLETRTRKGEEIVYFPRAHMQRICALPEDYTRRARELNRMNDRYLKDIII